MMYFRFSISLFLVSLLSISGIAGAELLDLNVRAESAILINADTGKVLYMKNAHTPRFPASTSKLATALYTLKKKGDKLNTKVKASQEAIGAISTALKKKRGNRVPAYRIEHGSSHVGIKRGEVMTLKDLLYGLMVASGNDAGNVIAEHVSGTIPQFMDDLNAYLKTLGCKDTNFLNPHGLPYPNNITTAWDLSIMTREAMKDPTFRKIVSTVRYKRPKTNLQEPAMWVQTNRLMRKGSEYYYKKAIGVKTGTTNAAGYNLVSAATDGERTLIAVVLKCKSTKDRFSVAKQLFEKAFAEKKQQKYLVRRGEQNVSLDLQGSRETLQTYVEDESFIVFFPSEEPKMKAYVKWDTLQLPIAKGDRVGSITILKNKEAYQELLLYASNDVHTTLLQSMKNLWEGYSMTLAIMSLFTASGLSFIVFRRRA